MAKPMPVPPPVISAVLSRSEKRLDDMVAIFGAILPIDDGFSWAPVFAGGTGQGRHAVLNMAYNRHKMNRGVLVASAHGTSVLIPTSAERLSR
jgi:hypothetical protein